MESMVPGHYTISNGKVSISICNLFQATIELG